jgi:Ti-type conjugative transfer relaxase TraA
MAIYHLSTKIISRRTGKSAMASAAYRSGGRLEDKRLGKTFDYTRRQGVDATEIVLPRGAVADWALDREQLWNAAEKAEKRHDARVAREIEVSLPHELSGEDRRALAREFAQGLADRYGVAVDVASHAPDPEGDARNWHAHLMLTTRQVLSDGLGRKSSLEMHDFDRAAKDIAPTRVELAELRQEWADLANAALERAGIDQRIDHRSFADRMIDLLPTQHQGVAATALARLGLTVDRQRLDEAAREHNAEKLARDPEEVLKLLDSRQSVFGKQDIAQQVGAMIDDAQTFQDVMAKVMASRDLVELQAERRDDKGRVIDAALYSTRRMIGIENRMDAQAQALARDNRSGVRKNTLDRALHWKAEKEGFALSAEQEAAVRHITGDGRLKAVVGVAGSGKSTMLDAARETWEREGYKVLGLATTRQAARNLQESAGIQATTMQRYVGLEAADSPFKGLWAEGKMLPDAKTVIVIDEAGLASSRLMQRTLDYAQRFGAKVVLVGDHEQLQSIGAGAAFRSIVDRTGAETLSEVRRQRVDWQREASVAFGAGRTKEALRAYADQGRILLHDTAEQTVGRLVEDYQKHAVEQPSQTRLALAYRHRDVNRINDTIRTWRKQRGELGAEQSYRVQYSDRPVQDRAFAEGDRILFKLNSADGAFKTIEGGIENGDLGTVRAVGDRLTVELDRRTTAGRSQTIRFDPAEYRAFTHGYAATVDSRQGVTVDQTFSLGDGMDKHRSYVTLTRHRDDATLYVSREQYRDLSEVVDRLGSGRGKRSTLDFERGAVAERAHLAEVHEAGASPREATPEERARAYVKRAEELGKAHAALPDNGRTRAARRELQGKLQALGREIAKDAPALAVIREKAPALGIERGHVLRDVARGRAPDRSLGRDGLEL